MSQRNYMCTSITSCLHSRGSCENQFHRHPRKRCSTTPEFFRDSIQVSSECLKRSYIQVSAILCKATNRIKVLSRLNLKFIAGKSGQAFISWQCLELCHVNPNQEHVAICAWDESGQWLTQCIEPEEKGMSQCWNEIFWRDERGFQMTTVRRRFGH